MNTFLQLPAERRRLAFQQVDEARGQDRLAGHDARNVKNQDLTPNMRWAAAVVCGPPWPIWKAPTTWGPWHEEECAIYAALAGATPDHA
jgi:hypothetical protein